MDASGRRFSEFKILVFAAAMVALAVWLPPSTVVESRGVPSRGDLRLVDGIEPGEGRLEVFNEDEWGTVCNVGFGRDEANVACRQLGHLNGRAVCCGPFGAGNASAPIWLSDLDCSAEPARLEDCEHSGFGMNGCSHFQDVDLVCSDQTTTTLSTSTTSSTSSTSFASCESTSTTVSTMSTSTTSSSTSTSTVSTTTDTVTTTSVTTTTLPIPGLIDNDLDRDEVGYFQMEIRSGGNSEFGTLTGEHGTTGETVTSAVIFEYLTFIDRGKPGRAFLLEGRPVRSDPNDPDTAISEGSFRGEENQIIDWSATSSVADGAAQLLTVFRFTARDAAPLGRLRVYQYLDEDVLGSGGDVFFDRGDVAGANLELFTIDALATIGLSQSGSLSRAKGLENASFAGWGADAYDRILPQLRACREPVEPEGKIRRLRRAHHRTLGRIRGPDDVVTVLAWDVDPLASEAVVISSLGGLPGIDVVLCGDGNIDDGEQCDGGDCCSDSCTFETAGTACTDDGDVCTDDLCDAAGQCTQIDNTAACDDGDACTTADTCTAGTCTGGPALVCDDGDPCTEDSCNAASGCEVGDPIPTCGTSCGDPNDSGRITSSDSLIVLRAAIGARPCQLQACDADGSCNITATDALIVLRKAVGRPIELACPTDPATQCAR